MTDAVAHIAGNVIIGAEVHVPPIGPWFADVVFADAPELSGRVTLVIADLSLVGTIDPARNGTRGEQRMCRVVGGAGGWGTLLPAKAYHADNGVGALPVAQDAAREAGETLQSFVPGASTVGIDYARQAGPAARALEVAAGGAAWWVNFDGTTQVGTRPSTSAAAGAYQMMEFDPRTRVAILAFDTLASISIGSVLSEHFDEPQTVREMTIVLSPETLRVHAWTGESASQRSRLAGLVETIVNRIVGANLWGSYRYRCVRMSVDRVELQPVSRRPGLPDVLPISMWPGVAGSHAELTPGAELLVEFIEGDPSQPVITGFVGKGGPGATPVRLTFDATTEMKLGANATQLVALANLVDGEFTKLTTTLGTGSNSGGAVVFGTPYVKGPVAATKVKAE